MNYDEAKKFLLSSKMNTSRPGLERIKKVLKALGNPERELNVVHVVGTNGKGSAANMLCRMLEASGIRTGLFSSPYISELTEYISCDGVQISRQDFAGISGFLADFLEKSGLELTHFEFVTVLSVLYFRGKNCICIYEAGMGGRMDATNIFEKSVCTVLTSVGLDHTSFLGTSLEQIALEKAGITEKGGTLIIHGDMQCQIKEVLKRLSAANGFNLEETACKRVRVKEHSLYKTVFDYGETENITINSGALYQLKNSVIAIAAYRLIASVMGFAAEESAIKEGLEKFKLKSRFEVIKKEPPIIADGGHNPDCIRELVKSLDIGCKYVFITGVMADKDYEAMYDMLSEYASCFICVDEGLDRALDSDRLSAFLKNYGIPVYNAKTCFVAAGMIKRMVSELSHKTSNRFIKKPDAFIFTGTLYMTDSFKKAVETVYDKNKTEELYRETVNRLTSKSFYPKKSLPKTYSIDGMRRLLKAFGSPESCLSVIHVAGTNGKGSTCSILKSIFKEKGLRTGLFTSPYITRFNERIVLDDRQIEDDLLAAISDAVVKEQDRLGLDLNQFALLTCAAFIYYNLTDADVVVLETGLGGTYDPTNIVAKPLCSVITNIGYDHMAVLGGTISEIASAKAGIIKKSVPVICYPVEGKAFKVISKEAREKNSPLISIKKTDVIIKESGENGTDFMFENTEFHLPLTGDFQAYNAATAIMAAKAACSQSDGRLPEITADDLISALKKVNWRGRLELVSRNPLCYIDGGHNIQCIEHVTGFFSRKYADKRKIYIAGFMKDKDYSAMLNVLSKNADILYLVLVKNDRSLSFLELTKETNQYNIEVKVFKELREAYAEALNAADSNTLICVTGSLYQLSDFYQLVKETGGSDG